MAQVASPFAPRPPQPTGLAGFILDQQAQFYRQLAQVLRALRAGDMGALAGLVGVSFLYGVFHAAGPGHGKAVISSYIVSTGETVRRGILLAGLSALVQALTAIVGVLILSLIFGATARTMTAAVTWIEIAAYALIVLIGLRLVWTKGRAFLARFVAWRSGRPVAGMACDDGCVHLPPAEQIARVSSLRETWGIVLAVGLRPCTGAVLVLVFALAQGILWAGIAATFAMAAGTAVTVAGLATLAAGAKGLAVRLASARTGLATVGLSALEVVAAAVVLAFGAALLSGYLVLERTMPF
jgi:ABC-type nickel/cobalt efflux system permease component RcnA